MECAEALCRYRPMSMERMYSLTTNLHSMKRQKENDSCRKNHHTSGDGVTVISGKLTVSF